MRPELRDFFDAMTRFLADGPPPVSDPRLALYARFIASHPRGMLEKNFPLTRRALGAEAWEGLVTRFVSEHPPQSWELNRAAAAFADFLERRRNEGATLIAPFIPSLARFEHTEFSVWSSEAEVPLPGSVEAPAPNPTLEVLAHPFRLVPFVLAALHSNDGALSEPEAGEETVLMWRHPVTHRTRFRSAEPGALLALKLVVEAIPLDRAAAEAGMTEDDLERLLAVHAAEGLVLLPSGAGRRPQDTP